MRSNRVAQRFPARRPLALMQWTLDTVLNWDRTRTWTRFWISFVGSFVTSPQQGYYVTIWRKSDECAPTMQLCSLKNKSYIGMASQGNTAENYFLHYWVMESIYCNWSNSKPYFLLVPYRAYSAFVLFTFFLSFFPPFFLGCSKPKHSFQSFFFSFTEDPLSELYWTLNLWSGV